ncbi:MAG: hypothetical protein LUC95_01040 [Lachnospiraceae bacterium]|nr:hypothetical protein [Lachnospiraceae bacterium]
MDLKNKHLVHLAEGLLWVGVMIFFTKAGPNGIIYTAGTLEIFYAVYRFFLGYLPDAVSRTARGKRNKERPGYGAAAVKGSFLYGFIASLLCMLVLFLLSKLCDSLSISYMGQLLRIYLWITPFGALLQVLRGILQTETGKTRTGISKIIVSVGTVIGTFAGVLILYPYGEKVGDFLQHAEVLYFYLALSVLPGILLGILAACIYLLALIIMHRYDFECLHGGADPKLPGAVRMAGILYSQVGIDSVVILLSRLPYVLLFFLTITGSEEEQVLFGAFYGVILPLIMIVRFALDLGLTSIERGMVSALRKRQLEYYYRYYIGAMKFILLSSAAAAVLFAALRKPYLALWQLQTNDSVMSLALGCAFLFFFSLPYQFSLDLMKLKGRELIIMAAMLIGNLGVVLRSVVFCGEAGIAVSVFVQSILIFYIVTAVIMIFGIEREIGTSPLTYLPQIWLPLLITCLIGLLMYGLQMLLFTALGGFATGLLGLFFGVALHFVCVGMTGTYSREELRIVPLGRVIARFRGIKAL